MVDKYRGARKCSSSTSMVSIFSLKNTPYTLSFRFNSFTTASRWALLINLRQEQSSTFERSPGVLTFENNFGYFFREHCCRYYPEYLISPDTSFSINAHFLSIWNFLHSKVLYSEVFCKKGVLRNFAKFTGKHPCQRLFFNKLAGLGVLIGILAQVFCCEFCKISKNAFSYRTTPVAASETWC